MGFNQFKEMKFHETQSIRISEKVTLHKEDKNNLSSLKISTYSCC